MANQQIPDIVVEDETVWKAVAGAASHHLPTVGSPVYYLPNLHRAATPGGFAGGQPPMVPVQIAAVVTGMELRAHGEDLYVRYRLVRRADGDDEGELPGLDNGVVTFNKKLSQSDLSTVRQFIIPKAMAESTLFPAPPPPSNPTIKTHDDAVQFVDIHNNQINLTRRHQYKYNKYVFHGEDWFQFHQGRRLQTDDHIAFIQRPTRNYLGLRRIREGMKIPLQDYISASQAAQQENQEFTVDYFPGRASQNEYVVLRSFVDRSLDWGDGTEVRMRSTEDDKGRAVFVDGVIRQPIGVDHSSRLFKVETARQTFRDIRPWNLIPRVLNLFR